MKNQVHIPHIASQLENTPPALTTLLSGQPDTVYTAKIEEGKWSIQEVVWHLIHADRTNWPVRIQAILNTENDAAFPAFDRAAPDPGCGSLAESLQLFATVRKEKLHYLRGLNLDEAQLDRSATHPELGAVTLGQLLATWAVHDFTHLAQVNRLLAKQYRNHVGPWESFLTILNR